jgi:hypothetical protein
MMQTALLTLALVALLSAPLPALAAGKAQPLTKSVRAETYDARVHGTQILTPPAGPAPAINGPEVYGVRPGSPVIYRIPTTGIRPIRFTAKDLPDTLHIDQAKGIITGRARKRGSPCRDLSGGEQPRQGRAHADIRRRRQTRPDPAHGLEPLVHPLP